MKNWVVCTRGVLAAIILAGAGCAASHPQTVTDLNSAVEVAAAVESAYAAQPNADPKAVAELTRLLASAQAAVTSFAASTSTTDLTVANAAIAALVAYEASAHISP